MTRYNALNLWGRVQTCQQSLKLTMESSLIQSMNYLTEVLIFYYNYSPIYSHYFSADITQFFILFSFSFYSSFISLSSMGGDSNSSNLSRSFPCPQDRLESTYNDDFYIDILRLEQRSLLLKQSLTHLSPLLLQRINLCM